MCSLQRGSCCGSVKGDSMAEKWEWAPRINVVRKKVLIDEDWWDFKSVAEGETSLMVLANGKCLLCVEVDLEKEK